MAQYIDKDALVAEIKRRRKLVSDPILSGNDLMIGERNALFDLLSFIDTLEVKKKDSFTSEEIKKICTIYENLKQERECATVLYNSDETFFNHVLMEYKSIAQKGE